MCIRDRHYGVFIDEPFSVADMRRIVAFGTSEGAARFSGFCAAQVWARDDTKLVVEVEDNAFVCIDTVSYTHLDVYKRQLQRLSAKRGRRTTDVTRKPQKTYNRK